MADRPTCYIAAPFAAPTAARRQWNIGRAEALAALARARGYAPLPVHRLIEAGVFGDDSKPEERAIGIACVGAWAAKADACWVLLRDDGTMSSGTEADLDAWDIAHNVSHHTDACVSATWAGWRKHFAAAGLGELWAGLVEAPDVAGVWERRRSWFRTYGSGNLAAYVNGLGWSIYDETERRIASGLETGAAGRAAADAALRAAGVEVRDE